MNIQELLEWRYATKVFDATKKVSEKDLNSLLKEANLSATSYGLQPFKFVVIGDQEIKDSLVEHSYGQKQVAENSHLIVLAVRTDIDADYIADYIASIEETRELPKGSVDDFKNIMLSAFNDLTQEQKTVWAQKQAYIILGTLMIVAAAKKIDGCPMEGFDPKAYDKILGLTKKNLHATLIFPIGYRAETDETQHYVKVRKSLNDIVVKI